MNCPADWKRGRRLNLMRQSPLRHLVFDLEGPLPMMIPLILLSSSRTESLPLSRRRPIADNAPAVTEPARTRRSPGARMFSFPYTYPSRSAIGPVGSEAASGGRSQQPQCYRMCHSLKDRSTLPVPPVSPVTYLRGHGATCSCLKYFRISLKSAVLSVTSVAPDSLQDAARRKSLTKDFGTLLSSRDSCRAIAAIEDPAWSQAEWLGVITRPALVKGPRKSSRICRAFEGVLVPTSNS